MGPQFESHCPKPGPSLGKLRLRIIYFIFPRSHCSRRQGWSQNPGPLARLSTVRGEWEVSPFSPWGPLAVRALAVGPPEDRVATRGPRPLLVPLDKGSDPLLLNRSFSRLGVASLPSGPQGARPAPSAALIAESSLTRFRRGGGGGREQMVLEWMHAEVPSGGSPAVCPGAGCSPSLRLGPHHLVAQRCWCPRHGVAAH